MPPWGRASDNSLDARLNSHAEASSSSGAAFQLRGRDVRLHLTDEGLDIAAEGGGAAPGLARSPLPLAAIVGVELLVGAARRSGRRACCSLLPRRAQLSHGLLVHTAACSGGGGSSSAGHLGARRLHLQQLELRCATAAQAQDWQQRLAAALAAKGRRPRRLLVFVNPFAGAKGAHATWERWGAPLMALAGVECRVRATEAPAHAEAELAELGAEGLAPYDGLVAVGGDGLFQELVTGLLALQGSSKGGGGGSSKGGGGGSSPLAQLRLGHIPAGSTDAVACTLHGTRDPLTAVLHIVLGSDTRMDVAAICPLGALPAAPVGSPGAGPAPPLSSPNGGQQPAAAAHPAAHPSRGEACGACQPGGAPAAPQPQPGGGLRHICCMASWGFMGSVLGLSEQLRWMGPPRYDAAGVLAFLAARPHAATIWYLPAEEEAGEPGEAQAEDAALGRGDGLGQPQGWAYAKGLAAAPPAGAGGALPPAAGQQAAPAGGALPPAAAALASGVAKALEEGSCGRAPQWRRVDGEFAAVLCAVSSCKSDRSRHGVAPFAGLADGRLALVLVRAGGRLRLLAFLLALSGGRLAPGRRHPHTRVLRVTAVQVVPGGQGGGGGRCAAFNLDGELVTAPAGVDVRVVPKALRVFACRC